MAHMHVARPTPHHLDSSALQHGRHDPRGGVVQRVRHATRGRGPYGAGAAVGGTTGSVAPGQEAGVHVDGAEAWDVQEGLGGMGGGAGRWEVNQVGVPPTDQTQGLHWCVSASRAGWGQRMNSRGAPGRTQSSAGSCCRGRARRAQAPSTRTGARARRRQMHRLGTAADNNTPLPTGVPAYRTCGSMAP